MTDAEKSERNEKNVKECLTWIFQSTLTEEDKIWFRDQVAKGGVYVAYGTLCRYDPDGGDGPGVYSLGGQLIEW